MGVTWQDSKIVSSQGGSPRHKPGVIITVGALPKQVYIEPAARADTFPALVFAHSVTWNTVKIISKSAIGNLK